MLYNNEGNALLKAKLDKPQKGQAQEKGGNPADGPCRAWRTANKEKDAGADGGYEQT